MQNYIPKHIFLSLSDSHANSIILESINHFEYKPLYFCVVVIANVRLNNNIIIIYLISIYLLTE
jgi:hypothetical protein